MPQIQRIGVVQFGYSPDYQQPQESAGSVLKNEPKLMLQPVAVQDKDPPLQIFGIISVSVGTVIDGMAHQDGELMLIEF